MEVLGMTKGIINVDINIYSISSSISGSCGGFGSVLDFCRGLYLIIVTRVVRMNSHSKLR
jgi:hypothetical protein